MKKLLIIFIFSFLSFDFASAISDLPRCKGKDYNYYVNCYGSYKDKDYSEIYNTPGLTNNYVGEFGDLPGLTHGHGIADVYEYGEYKGTYVGNFKNDKLDGLATFIGQNFFSVVEYKLDEFLNGTDFLVEDKIVYVGQYNKDGEWNGLGAAISPDGWIYNVFKNNEIVENNEELSAINKINHSPCKGTDLPQDRSEWRDCTVHNELFTDNNTDGSISKKYIKTGWHGFNEVTEIYSGEVRRHQSKWLSVYEDYQERPKFEGKGIVETYFDGKLNLIYIGEFEKGLRSGYGTQYDVVNNSVYVGQFENNNFNGHGTYIQKDEKYVGNFSSKDYHGAGILFTKDKRNISAFKWGKSLYEIEHNVKINKDVALSCEAESSYGSKLLKLKLDKNLNRLTVSSNFYTHDGKPSYYSNFNVEEILLNSDEYLIGFYRDDELDKNFHFMLDKYTGEFVVKDLYNINDKYVISPTGSPVLLGYTCKNKLF